MLKIEDIITPKTIEEFRHNLKKYCLGNTDSIFIYNKINRKQYKIKVNNLSKISDVFKFLKKDSGIDITARECNVVLMCDLSKISVEDLMIKQEDALRSLRKVYLFNNQDSEERSNFLNSSPDAIEKIVSREKVTNEIDTSPLQTAVNQEILSGLYYHLFGEYFDTVSDTKMKYNLSKYN